MLRRETVAVVLLASAIGCSSSSTSVPNPFNSADRVAAPAYQSGAVAPAATTPYYQEAPAAFPQQQPIGQGAAPVYSPNPTTSPAVPFNSSPAPGTATPVYSAPPAGGGFPPPQGSASRPSLDTSQLAASGDQIAIPTDQSSVRFGNSTVPSGQAPIAREPATLVASRPATANGWIAGSAPVRSGTAASTPRVRLPGEIGVEEPLRVASPPSSTGWR